MKTCKRFGAIPSVLAIFVALAAGAAFADPPSRVVRLKYMSGEVSVQPGGVNDWVAGVVNRPLTTGDRVWTDKDARAELNLGSASLRANAETSMTLTNVSDDIVQFELDQGTLNLHIRHLFDGETFELDTPNLAFTILKSGDYRFDVDPNADTTYITVWNGEGEATGQGPGVKLHRGEQASFTGGTSLQHQTYNAPQRDGFDDWCRVRSDREDHSESYRYVSADVIGADDLDQYGTWRTEPSYGAVWIPAVAPGWAPYHYGHWIWVEPWGWTWVDDAPWGFAPAHYGRWVNIHGYWGWSPGPPVVAVVRPVYAPALVAWVGGPHLGVSVSFGGGAGVGWFPLGWGEPYVPGYAVSRTYFQRVNVTNTHITNITNVTNNYYVTNNNTTVINNNVHNIHYVNQNVSGAVTAVPQRSFVNSEPVARNAVRVEPGEMKSTAVGFNAPVAPERNSVLGMNSNKAAVAPPQAAVGRTVVSHNAPPPQPVPFAAKQDALAKNPGRPLDAQTEAAIRTTAARNPVAVPNRGINEPMHPGVIDTPNGAAMPHPAATPAQPMKPATPATPGVANTPTSPGRAVPRPQQPGMSQPGQPGSSQVGTAPATTYTGPSHAQPNPAVPANTESMHPTPAAPPAQVRQVPRPPQASQPVATQPQQPVQPVRVPANDNQPRPPQTGGQPVQQHPMQPERFPADDKPRGNAQPTVNPAPARAAQPEPRPEPVQQHPVQPERFPADDKPRGNAQPTVNPAPARAPQPELRPASHGDSQPRVVEPKLSEPRPQAPKPIYQSQPPHEELKPRAESHPAPHAQQPSHEDSKHNNPR